MSSAAAGDTGDVNGDIELRIDPDGTYTGTCSGAATACTG